jgi:hypothetical protein
MEKAFSTTIGKGMVFSRGFCPVCFIISEKGRIFG